jgi:DNA-binding transcriptional ArsR family regulator
MEKSYNETLKYYKNIWINGNIDLIVTRFSSMINALEKDNIHYKYLSPSSKSMLETFNGLLIHLNVNVPQNSATCIGIVTSSDSSITNLQFRNLSIKLQTFNDKFGKPFLIYDHGDNFEIATDSITIKDLTKKYTICPLASFLKDSLNFPINVGWGEDYDVIKARKNATAALKEAKKSDDFSSFLISYGEIIGPLNNDGYLSADKNESSFSSLYLSKLKSYMEENETDLVTSKDLSEYLSITVRSASRILKKLSKNGIVILEDMQQINSRGRPTQVYKIDI